MEAWQGVCKGDRSQARYFEPNPGHWSGGQDGDGYGATYTLHLTSYATEHTYMALGVVIGHEFGHILRSDFFLVASETF